MGGGPEAFAGVRRALPARPLGADLGDLRFAGALPANLGCRDLRGAYINAITLPILSLEFALQRTANHGAECAANTRVYPSTSDKFLL